MSNELLIKINADAKNAKKAFDDLRNQTNDLEGVLATTAKVAAVAFAAFTAEIFLSVHAFEESEASSRKLANALQNQGIFTEDLVKSYKAYAEVVQEATGLDDDAVTSSQAVLQSYLGQTEVTQELTFAIADLAEKMNTDLDTAAQTLGKTIGTSTNALAKQGLQLSDNATAGERMAKTLAFVSTQAGGMATAANQGVGGIRGLTTAFGNFQEAIGSKFAPVIAAAIKIGTDFFNMLNRHPIVADLAASLLTAGVAVSGLMAAIAVGVPAFLALSAAATAAGISLSIAFVGIPLLIGAIIAGITLLALNWGKVSAFMVSAGRAAVELLTGLFHGLGNVLQGVFTFNRAAFLNGLKQIGEALKKTKDVAVQTYQEETASLVTEEKKQDEAKKAAAAAREAHERQHQANLVAIRKASIDILKLQNEHASSEAIQLKQQEIEVLKQLDQDKSQQELALLREKRDEIKALEDEQRTEDLERITAFEQIKGDMVAELEGKKIEVSAGLRDQKLAELQANAMTEADIDRKVQEDIIASRTASRNQMLLDQKKYGTSFATINKALHSDEVKGAEGAAGELVQLSQSKNSTLKAIGKAAAVTQIGIDTAKGAMAVYANFQTAIPYPPVSVPLGLAAAAALTVYGVERISNVMSAAQGGLVEGGVPGLDSVPAMLMPGELVVPRKNFNDVVGAVQGGPGTDPEMLATLKAIEQKTGGGQTTIIQGDVHTDDAYIDTLVRKISDAVQYRNGQIFGVTA